MITQSAQPSHLFNRAAKTALASLFIGLCMLSAGCQRHHYRMRADRDVEAILQEKTAQTPWRISSQYSASPDPRSRFFDASPTDHPQLPYPGPQLNTYLLPPLATGDPTQPADANQPTGYAEPATDADQQPPVESLPLPPGTPDAKPNGAGDLQPAEAALPLLPPENGASENGAAARLDMPLRIAAVPPTPVRLPRPEADKPDSAPSTHPSDHDQRHDNASPVRLAMAQTPVVQAAQPPATEADSNAKDAEQVDSETAGDEDPDAFRVVPIPPAAWEPLPASCLGRMFEFESVREEYRRSFGEPPPRGGDGVPRLTLANTMELALLNSRAYQSNKERLYRVALRLTRERYQYDLNPIPFGNGSAANFRHFRAGGATVNTLGVPTGAAVQRSLATGGQFLASFANDVVLTFNGPQGFTSNIGSQLLFDFQQTVFQTDVELESLTQSERDVVYAARDLIRFRRGLFRDLASQYYNLLLSYRSIEIGSQDYFSNQRAFLQGQAEYLQAGRLPRVQVDQFEQNALRSRSDLVASCNSLETSLDRLKLAIGLPPEMPVNLTLDELEALSATDQLTVARQLVQRTQTELSGQREQRRPSPAALINAASVLTDRLLDIQRLSQAAGVEATWQTGGEDTDLAVPKNAIEQVAQRLAVLEARGQVEAKRMVLSEESNAQLRRQLQLEQQSAEGTPNTPLDSPLRVYLRTVDVIEASLVLARRAIEAAPAGTTPAPDARERLKEYNATLDQLNAKLDQAVVDRELNEIPDLTKSAQRLLVKADQLADETSAWLVSPDRESFLEMVTSTVSDVIRLSDEVVNASDVALPEVEVEPDDAMLTALVQRLDLMNRRGDLADSRRAIKLAADDLRSILDLRATQTLRTRTDANTPFDFSFNDSQTRLSMALDTPLNRRAQRNNYRLALIDYNQTLRNLIESEDEIKFDIREDLRRLRLRRDQYEIAIASAALAYERVVSTRLQLQFAVKDVVARDFLEAQQAYTAALSSVARQHIAYILDRIELFFDMEGIQLDDNGYWPGLRDDDLQPPVNVDFPGTNPYPYGRLVPGLHYSREIKATQ